MKATYVGGPACGRTFDIDPDAAPADKPDLIAGSRYVLTERVTGRGPGCPPDTIVGMPIYAYEPLRAAPERTAPPACRCGCARSLFEA